MPNIQEKVVEPAGAAVRHVDKIKAARLQRGDVQRKVGQKSNYTKVVLSQELSVLRNKA